MNGCARGACTRASTGARWVGLWVGVEVERAWEYTAEVHELSRALIQNIRGPLNTHTSLLK